MQVDANGIIQDGPFQGSHIDDLEKYTTDLQAHIVAQAPKGQTPPQAPQQHQQQPPQNPNQTLQNHAAQRVAPLHAVMLGRMEQDDEAEFSRTVQDYAKFKEKIDKIKEGLTAEARVQKGLHKQLYGLVKLNDDPATRHAMFGEPLPPTQPPSGNDPATVDPNETPQGGEKKEENQQPHEQRTQEDLIKQVAKPAGPATAPPAGGRHNPNKDTPKTPKLKATDKLEKAAKALGKPLNDYLLALEAEGVTQDMIDSANVRKSETKRQSRIYGLGVQ
jgi:hypothetical protein